MLVAEAPANAVGTTIASPGINNSQTTIPLVSATGFPTGQYHCRITDGNNNEIVMVTSRSGTTLTVVRDVESWDGSSGSYAFAAGSTVTIVMTTRSIIDLIATWGGTVYNVVAPDYGAVGDGSTVNTTAIQAAITAAEVAGGTVYVPNGNYVTGQLTISSPNVLLLLSPGATLTAASGTTGDLILITASRSKVRDGIIAAANASGCAINVNASGTSQSIVDVRIEGVEVSSSSLTGIRFSQTGSGASNTLGKITGCYVHDLGNGTSVAEGIGLYGASDCEVSGNRTYNTPNHGIVSTEGFNNRVTNNDVQYVGTVYYSGFANGIAFDGNGGANPNGGHIISNNRIYHVRNSGIEIADGVYDFTVTGNTVYVTGLDGGTGEDFGIYAGGGITNCYQGVISGNTVDTAGYHGIMTAAASGRSSQIAITGNWIGNCGGAGIYSAATDDWVIANNIVTGNSTVGSGSFGGIELASSPGPGVIEGNRVWGPDHSYNIHIASTPTNTVLIQNNIVLSPYASGPIGGSTGTVCIIRNNVGYNPVGSTVLGTPFSLPGSTSTWTNGTCVDGTLYCTAAGVVTGVAVNGVTISGTMVVGDNYRIVAGGTFKPTYSSSPTLVFVGD